MTVMTTERRPYDASNVIYLDEGHSVWVLWTADPTATAKTINVMANDVQVVAHMGRVYKRGGHDYSGWLLSCRRDDREPIATNKPDAMRILRQTVAEYFNR